MKPERKWLIAIGTYYVAGLGHTSEGNCSGQHIPVTPGIVITRLENRAMKFTSGREAGSLARRLGGRVRRCQGKEKSRPGGTGTTPGQNNQDHSNERGDKMQDLPDAPWIREAEMYGMPPYDDGPDPTCPVCGEECETIYTDKDGEPVGCDQCVTLWEAYEWCDKHREERN